MAELHFEFTGSSAQLESAIRRAIGATDQMRASMEKSGDDIEKMFKRVKQAAAMAAAGFSMKSFAQQIVSIRGQMQQLEVSFKTMLGSATQADALMQQLIRTAATTPFDLKGVADGARQLLAYGVEADKVNSTLIRLGDIAAGLSIPLGDLVYLYGTTMAQGRLYTQDLNQFTGRGIPMIQELAKQFGVADSEVKKLVEEGKVGFPEVQKVIESLTDAGGKFGGLMEGQSRTISGQIANLQDNIDMMFNEIGQQQEGLINDVLSAAAFLVDHYETVAKAVVSLVAAYGAYRTALMLVTAASGWATAAEALQYNWLLLCEKAQKLLNATMLSNPYVLIATLVAGLVVAMIAFNDSLSASEAAQKSLNDEVQRATEKYEAHKRELEKQIQIASDDKAATDDRRAALNNLIKRYPSIISKYIDEEGHLTNILKLKQEIAEIDGKRQVAGMKDDAEKERQRANYVNQLLFHKKRDDVVPLISTGTWLDSLVERYKKASGRSWKDGRVTYGELQDFYNTRADAKTTRYNRRLTTDKISAFQSTLKDKSNEALQGIIAEMQDVIVKSNRGRRSVLTKSVGDYLKRDDAIQLQAVAQGIIDARKHPKKTEDNGGGKEDKKDTSSKSSADTAAEREAAAQAEYRKKVSDENRSWALQQERDAEKYQQQIDQTRIDTMQAGSEKVIAQIEHDYRNQQAAIKAEAIDLKEANADHAKRLFEADPKNKGKDFYQSQTYTEAYALTPEQEAYIAAKERSAETARDKALADRQAKEQDAMQQYLIDYGTYQEQRLAIAEKYAKLITDAETEGDRKGLAKQRDKEIAELDFKEMQKGIDWEGIFGDLANQSTAALKSNLAKVTAEYQARAAQGTLPTEEVKNFQEAIRNLENELLSRDPFSAMADSVRKLRQALEEARKAEADLVAAHAEQQAAQAEYDSASLAFGQLQSGIETGQVSQDDTAYVTAKDRMTAATQRLADANARASSAEETSRQKTAAAANAYTAMGTKLQALKTPIDKVGKAASGLAGVFSKSVAKAIDDTLDIFDKLTDLASTTVSAMGSFGKATISVVGTTADATSQGVQAGSKAAGKAVEGVEKASVILAVITAALQVATAIFSLFSKTDYMKAVREEMEKFAKEVDEMRYKTALEDKQHDGIFGTDKWAKMQNAVKLTNEYLGKFREDYDALANRKETFFHLTGKGAEQMAISFQSAEQSLASMRVQTQHGTWFRSAKFSSLKDIAPELFKGDGSIDYDALSKFVDSELFKRLSKENQEMVEQMVTDYKRWQESLEEVRNYLSDIFGDLGSSISDALTNAFKNGTDAAQEMTKSISKMIETLVKQMAYSVAIAPYAKKAQDQMEKIMTDETKTNDEKIKESMDVLGEFYDGIQSGGQQLYEGIIAGAKEEAAKRGFDLFSSDEDEQTGETRGFQAMTQDTAEELNGRFTSLQISGEAIREQNDRIATGITQVVTFSTAIATDTAELHRLATERNDILEQMHRLMKDNLTPIRAGIADIKDNTSRL